MFSIVKPRLFVLLSFALEFVACNDCNATYVDSCFDVLIGYEGQKFPLYGFNTRELAETCLKMKDSLECLSSFKDQCIDDPNCDGDCQMVNKMISQIGFVHLYEELCLSEEELKELYLEHASCLGSASDMYSHCYNISQQVFMHLDMPRLTPDMPCCFISWYRSCYVDATAEKCGLNSSLMISQMLDLLLGSHETRCGERQACLTPPPPAYKDPEFESPSTTKVVSLTDSSEFDNPLRTEHTGIVFPGILSGVADIHVDNYFSFFCLIFFVTFYLR